MLLTESIGTQGIDIARSDFGWLAVQLGAEIEQRFVGNRDLCVNVVNRDLFRFRPFQLQHSHNFAMCRDTIRTEVCGGTHQEDVFFLPSRKRAFGQQEIAGKGHLGVNQIWTRSLRREEIRQESKLLPDRREHREVFFIIRLAAQVGHWLTPKLH